MRSLMLLVAMLAAGCSQAHAVTQHPVGMLRPIAVPQLAITELDSLEESVISEDGSIAVTPVMGSVYVWDVERGVQIRRERGAKNVALSRDARTLLLVDDQLRVCPLAIRACMVAKLPIGELVRSYGSQRAGFTPSGSHAFVCKDDSESVLVDVTNLERVVRVDGCVIGALDGPDGSITAFVQRGAELVAVRWRGLGRGDPSTVRLAPSPLRRIDHAALSDDGTRLLVGGDDGAYLLELGAPDRARLLRRGKMSALAFDGRTPIVLDLGDVCTYEDTRGEACTGGRIGAAAGTARLSWDGEVTTPGKRRQLAFVKANPHLTVRTSPDGNRLVLDVGNTLWRWDVRDPRDAARIELGGDPLPPLYPAALFDLLDDQSLVVSRTDVRTIDLATEGATVFADSTRPATASALAISPDRQAIFRSGGPPGRVGAIWPRGGGQPLALQIPGMGKSAELDDAQAAAFSPSGRYLITGSANGAARVWNTATGHQVTRLDHLGLLHGLAVSDDGHAITIDSTGSPRRWTFADPRTRPRVERVLGWQIGEMRPGARFLVVDGFVVDDTGAQRWRLPPMAATHEAVSEDGERVLAADADRDAIRVFHHGRELDSIALDHLSLVELAFQAPGVIRGIDELGTLHFWRTCEHAPGCRDAGSAELLQIIGIGTDWVAIDPDGRYDTSNFDALGGLAWVLPDHPLEALPADLFIRSYYVPGLVAKVLSGKALQPAADLTRIDRRVPRATITKVAPVPGDAARAMVTLDVEVAGGEAYDLHLFRDGALAAEQPLPFADHPSNDVARWRTYMRVAPGTAAHQSIALEIPLSRTATSVELSAYAFNRERLKGPTSRMTYKYEPPPLEGKPRAVILSLGVGPSGEGLETLDWAPIDAIAMSRALAESLASKYRVVQVPLVSASTRWAATGEPCFALRRVLPSTGGSLVAMLSRLAGLANGPALGTVDSSLPCAMTSLDLQDGGTAPLAPDDVLILYVSAHGVDANGELAIVTEGGDRMLISALATWLNPIHSDHIIVILDTCESASAVAAGTFRPAPLGDFTFGQLAFDKSMQILAASGASEDAVDSAQLGGSLLVHALRERLAHGPVAAGTLLRRAMHDVPALFRQLGIAGQVQRPVVFDYRRGNHEVVFGAP